MTGKGLQSLYHLFMVIWGMVYYCCTHIQGKVEACLMPSKCLRIDELIFQTQTEASKSTRGRPPLVLWKKSIQQPKVERSPKLLIQLSGFDTCCWQWGSGPTYPYWSVGTPNTSDGYPKVTAVSPRKTRVLEAKNVCFPHHSCGPLERFNICPVCPVVSPNKI